MRTIIAVGVLGFAYSVFLGIYSSRIFNFEGRLPKYTESTRPGWTWRVFQFWLNFSCCAVGWAIVIHYLSRILASASQFSFKGDDAIPMIVGLLGITGLLPRTLFFGKTPWKSD